MPICIHLCTYMCLTAGNLQKILSVRMLVLPDGAIVRLPDCLFVSQPKLYLSALQSAASSLWIGTAIDSRRNVASDRSSEIGTKAELCLLCCV